MLKIIKARWLLVLLLIFQFSVRAEEEKRIEAIKAPFYVGQTVMACGKLAEVTSSYGRNFLNLDAKYPSHSLAILIWDDNFSGFIERFGNFDKYIGRRFCARGTITEYKNSLEMNLKNPNFLRLMNN